MTGSQRSGRVLLGSEAAEAKRSSSKYPDYVLDKPQRSGEIPLGHGTRNVRKLSVDPTTKDEQHRVLGAFNQCFDTSNCGRNHTRGRSHVAGENAGM